MSTDEERWNHTGLIRVFTITACASLAAAIAFMILELTTDLDAATGAFIFLTLFVLNVGLILARRRQEVATDTPVVPF
ncbi:hypothetical protein C5C41_05080 [Rathayibacter sp. AY1E9]|jgi:F0F1-type ATP synthase assembly protein I|uniref:hypothetical protein n=1 Tax=unclassified Rathayibacter TaxID=2609250 RepID=UPI000CE80E1D|nr:MULTISPECIES: hypothetical protein [unclassified Rathayibacter]PPF16844.1 hypothetical protein C5B92_10850 [Rathayibacter sp. AY1A4]PPF19000.1 hypothetical protein C5B95_10775 [Rathayibacter sp. AY1A7]PPF40996.1 hypothetical protein C5C10_00285 [Rathayibacter sp. AY1A3]PPF54782.1 hypothetical protein C5C55_11320 [Rathayibacter sp. AY1C2]PPG54218.1 hypothetical protein C5C41_05080 [Rathayibacter sp. AY1E9]